MKIDINDHSVVNRSHVERIEQLALCLLDSQQALIHHAISGAPDVPRLRAISNRIVDLIQRLYGSHGGTLQ